jgi:AcrR family transcriptional regulator
MKKKRVVDPEGKKTAILDAALNEMVTKGFHGMKSVDISNQAEVGAGTVFKIFKNKQNLANEVLKRSHTRYNEFMQYVYDEPDPKTQFDMIWTIFTKMIDSYPDDFIFYELHIHQDFIDKKTQGLKDELEDILNRWLGYWKRKKVLKSLPPLVMQSLILGALGRIIRNNQEGKCQVNKRMLNQIRDACWDAITA